MRLPTLLVLAVLAVIGGAAYWLSLGAAPITPPAAETPRTPQPNAQPANGQSSPQRVAAPAADATQPGTAEATSSERPHPSNATWVDVLVVNGAGEAVPGATVYWYDDDARDLLKADKTLTGVQQVIQIFQPCSLATRYGWSAVADAEGRARVTVSDSTLIAGKSGGLFGQLAITTATATPIDGHRLVLLPDDTIRALLLDENDEPCRDVPITLMMIDPEDDPVGLFGYTAIATSNEEGIAEIPHVQDWQRRFERDDELDGISVRSFVHVLAPHNDDPGVQIDLKNPPEELIVMRVPACGTVKVRVDLPGVASKHEMAITASGSARYDGYMVGKPANDGWTHFANVPVGKRFIAHSLAASNISQEFDGPRAQGDTVEVVIQPPRESIVLRAHIVDDEGNSVALERLSFTFTGKGVPRHRQVMTDEHGTALVSMPTKGGAAVTLESAKIEAYSTERYGTGYLDRQVWKAGFTDLGDIALERGALIASGQLMAGTAPYTKEIFADVQTFVANPKEGEPQWQAIHDHLVSIEPDGRFEAYATLPAGSHRLQFHGEHNQPVDPTPFRIGQKGLVVQIPVGHALGATFLLPTHVRYDAVQCRLIPAPTDASATAKEYAADSGRAQAEQCVLEWRGLPAGTYTLELALWAQPQPMVRVADVVVPPPQHGDARLVDIDLRDLVQIVTVELREPDGTPAEGYGALFSQEQMVAGKWHGHPVSNSTTRVTLPSGPVDMRVLLEGYQPATVRGSGPTLTARVFPWPTVALHLAGSPQLPENLEFKMQLEAATPIEGSWRGPYRENRLKPLVGVGSHAWAIKDGKIELRIGEGAHRLRVFVSKGRRKVEVQGITPAQILPTERNVSVHLPKASLQAAIDAFSK